MREEWCIPEQFAVCILGLPFLEQRESCHSSMHHMQSHCKGCLQKRVSKKILWPWCICHLFTKLILFLEQCVLWTIASSEHPCWSEGLHAVLPWLGRESSKRSWEIPLLAKSESSNRTSGIPLPVTLLGDIATGEWLAGWRVVFLGPGSWFHPKDCERDCKGSLLLIGTFAIQTWGNDCIMKWHNTWRNIDIDDWSSDGMSLLEDEVAPLDGQSKHSGCLL
jgi:hypothetical protein